MIVFSRNRMPSPWENGIVEALADRFGRRVLSIPFLYDLRSFGPTVQRLREITEPAVFVAPLPVRTSLNLLDAIVKPKGSTDVFVSIVDSTAAGSVDDVFDILAAELAKLETQGDFNGARTERIDEPTARRWYPVIDKRRCTGCLECVNFCLFGVYVIGEGDFPLVDQPDACRDGCPACSRVCPGRAIMFPMHDDGIIAGYDDPAEDAFDSAKADEERRRHLGNRSETPEDGLDDLVDRIDRFTPKPFY